MSTLERDQIQASDSLITRNRTGRILFYIASFLVVIGGTGLLFAQVAGDWFRQPYAGLVVGLMVGWALFFGTKLNDNMIVRVESQRAFLTLDLWRSFTANEKVYIAYGPGFHFSFPWEQRLARNNVSLVEATENFEVSVVTKTGIVTLKGSYRLRPRLGTESLVAFLGGVAVIAEDIADLIKSMITEILSKKTLDDVSKEIKSINDALAKEFGTGGNTANPKVSDFEDRFGIVVGDVTAAEVKLSDEAMKTRNAIDEAVQFANGVALIVGYKSSEEMQAALANNTLSAETVENARKQFLALSENVKMDIRDWTFNIKGLEHLDRETIRAVGDAALLWRQSVEGSKKK